MEISFCGGMSKGRSVSVDGAECVNLYPEITGASQVTKANYITNPDSKSNMILIGTPGTVEFTKIPGYGVCRRLYASALGRLFAIIGNKFYEIKPDKSYIVLGTLNTDSGYVSIAENNFQLMLCDGNAGYIYNFQEVLDNSGNIMAAAETFVTISDPAYPLGNSVICINGFFIQNEVNTSNFWFSKYQNGLIWDGTWFYAAEGSADPILAIGTINNEIWLFGSKSIEIWYNHPPTGTDAYDIFSRVNNTFLNIGLASIASVATISNTIFWLGSNLEGNNTIYSGTGYTPGQISTHSLEYLLSQMTITDDAIGMCYQQEGHAFYVLTFPNGNQTYCYDTSTGLWHERGRWNKSTGTNDAWPGICCVFWNNKNYIGDYQNGSIHQLDLNVYTDNGNPIIRKRTGGHIHSDRQRLFFHEFEIDLQRGIGLTSGQGSNPKACLQWSDDGGYKWSNEYWSSPGKKGDYRARLHWHRLGYSRDRIFRLTVSDPVKWVVIGCRGDIEIEKE
jgi:hypothetical protein